MKEFEQHEINKVLPPFSDQDYALLKSSLNDKGFIDMRSYYETNPHDLSHTVALFDNKIVDGWHRYNACRELGIDPIYSHLAGDEDEAKGYLYKMNSTYAGNYPATRTHETIEHLIKLEAKMRLIDNGLLNKERAIQVVDSLIECERCRRQWTGAMAFAASERGFIFYNSGGML